MYGLRPTTTARPRELERAHEGAEARCVMPTEQTPPAIKVILSSDPSDAVARALRDRLLWLFRVGRPEDGFGVRDPGIH